MRREMTNAKNTLEEYIPASAVCPKTDERQLRVTICSHHIAENKGGLASITRLTAKEFANQGFKVTILTCEDDGKFTHPNVAIIENPSHFRCLREIWVADYVICEGAALQLCWPLSLIPKKVVVVNHMARKRGGLVRRVLERLISFHAVWCGVSRYVAEHETIKTTVVPNAYDPKIFYPSAGERPYDLIFVGSMTNLKGVPLLFEAVKSLAERGVRINRLTLVGEGPLAEVYKKQLSAGGFVACEVVFTGNLPTYGVAEQMRRHKCLIAPSVRLVQEAFGLVCIEGAGCGCYVIASDSGGLPEAVGPCGAIFKSDDSASLADKIEAFLDGASKVDEERVKQHLSKYTPEALVASYLKLMNGRRSLK